MPALPLTARDLGRAVAVGIATALILSVVMVPANLSGLAPMPKPPSLAFAELVLGTGVPLPVGLLFHVAWVTLWAAVFVALWGNRPNFGRALILALALWLVTLVVFFPMFGWGLLGLSVGPQMIVGALVPHLLFAVVLWALVRWQFGRAGG